MKFEISLLHMNTPVDTIMVEQRAREFSKRSIKNESKSQGLRLILSMIDLTTLEGKDSAEKIRSLCQKATHLHNCDLPNPLPRVAAICVYPNFVHIAKKALKGTGVKVASVATGFPSGQYSLEVRLDDVKQAVTAGADEIDMVINRGAFLSGDFKTVENEIVQVRKACKSAHLKIILETGELETLENVRLASDLAIQAAASAGPIQDGEVFIKTSTGKISPASTMPVALVMLESIRNYFNETGIRIGMKPAGGIRTAKQSLHYLAMLKETLGQDWLTPRLFRFGASSLANDVLRQLVKQHTGCYPAAYDFSEA